MESLFFRENVKVLPLLATGGSLLTGLEPFGCRNVSVSMCASTAGSALSASVVRTKPSVNATIYWSPHD
jgi:hypothetical protein